MVIAQGWQLPAVKKLVKNHKETRPENVGSE